MAGLTWWSGAWTARSMCSSMNRRRVCRMCADTTVMDGANPLTVPTGRASVAVVDLDGDGRKDLVLGNTEGQLLFFANVGTDAAPQFSGGQLLQADNAVVDLAGSARSRPFVGDVDQDGVPDVLIGAADGLVRLYAGSRNAATGPSSTTGDPGGTYVYAFRVQPPRPWQCPAHSLDVANDGQITALDALMVINHLNAHGPGTLPALSTGSDAPPPYLDCSGDGAVTAPMRSR